MIATITVSICSISSHSSLSCRRRANGKWKNNIIRIQYSLLQTAIEACQKRTQCKFYPEPKSFGGNPCPGIRKIVEYAYKCRPCKYHRIYAWNAECVWFLFCSFCFWAIFWYFINNIAKNWNFKNNSNHTQHIIFSYVRSFSQEKTSN